MNDCGSRRNGFGSILTCAAPSGVCRALLRRIRWRCRRTGVLLGLTRPLRWVSGRTPECDESLSGRDSTGCRRQRCRPRLRRCFVGNGRMDIDGPRVNLARYLRERPLAPPRTSLPPSSPLYCAAVDACLDGSVRTSPSEVVWRRLRSVRLSHPDRIRLLSAARGRRLRICACDSPGGSFRPSWNLCAANRRMRAIRVRFGSPSFRSVASHAGQHAKDFAAHRGTRQDRYPQTAPAPARHLRLSRTLANLAEHLRPRRNMSPTRR